jgi:hypothetical protein
LLFFGFGKRPDSVHSVRGTLSIPARGFKVSFSADAIQITPNAAEPSKVLFVDTSIPASGIPSSPITQVI